MDSFFRQFKSVSDAMKEDFNRSKNGSISQFSDRQRHLIKLIFSYMMSCKWQDTESTKKLMEVWDLPDSKAAKWLNISANTVRSKQSTASKSCLINWVRTCLRYCFRATIKACQGLNVS